MFIDNLLRWRPPSPRTPPSRAWEVRRGSGGPAGGVRRGFAHLRDRAFWFGAVLVSQNPEEEILKAYPYLEKEDIRAALAYATWRVEEIEVAVARG